MKEQYATIVAGCLAAFDCLKRGEPHEQANEMLNRTAAKYAAFLLPLSNQIQSTETSMVTTENKSLIREDKVLTVVPIVGTSWEFPDGERIGDFSKADQKAKQLGMVLEHHKKWRFSKTE